MAFVVSGVALWYSRRTFLLNYNPSLWISAGEMDHIALTNLGSRGLVITDVTETFDSFGFTEGHEIQDRRFNFSGTVEPNKSIKMRVDVSAAFISPFFIYTFRYAYGSDTAKSHVWRALVFGRHHQMPLVLKQGKVINEALLTDWDWLHRELRRQGVDDTEAFRALTEAGSQIEIA